MKGDRHPTNMRLETEDWLGRRGRKLARKVRISSKQTPSRSRRRVITAEEVETTMAKVLFYSDVVVTGQPQEEAVSGA